MVVGEVVVLSVAADGMLGAEQPCIEVGGIARHIYAAQMTLNPCRNERLPTGYGSVVPAQKILEVLALRF